MNKKPWLAALLSFFFFGLGYVYNGKRVGAGWILTAAVLLIRFGEINIFRTNLVPNFWMVLTAGLFILQFYFAFDAWQEAKNISKA